MYSFKFLAKIFFPKEIASRKTSGLHSHVELNMNISAAWINNEASLRSPHTLTFEGTFFIKGPQYSSKLTA